ncbi:MAG: ATP-binding cassette domain-containing protein [Idiomarina sp.]
MLVINNLTIRLQDAEQALLTLPEVCVKKGEVAVLMGASGSGKSTALRWLIGESQPDFDISGQVLLNDTDITEFTTQDRDIGLLFQNVLLFPHMTVAENLAFALPKRLRKAKPEEKREHVQAMLASMEMADFGEVYPETLSGGQQARIGLARALMNEPAALLLDEPFSALDMALRDSIRSWTYKLLQEWQVPALVVSHDIADSESAQQVIYV